MPNAAIALPPPLVEGDHLDSAEFLRRWEAMPDLYRAELLGGAVSMPSPVSAGHGTTQSAVTGWLNFYEALTPGCVSATDSTWVMGQRDVPQPDVSLRVLPEHGGQSRMEGRYTAGAPELIVEVAMTSHSRDLRTKLQIYERAGVQEYITALVPEKKLIWRVLTEGKYKTIAPTGGVYRSRVFPGLWLDVAALWRGDKRALKAMVEVGTATEAHAQFAARLRKA
ncbi:MAG: Uma2 family endonuclease [Bryobacteraceae bacterium]